jgi:hypothetical protein
MDGEREDSVDTGRAPHLAHFVTTALPGASEPCRTIGS